MKPSAALIIHTAATDDAIDLLHALRDTFRYGSASPEGVRAFNILGGAILYLAGRKVAR